MDRNDTTPSREKDPTVVELPNEMFRDTLRVTAWLAETGAWLDAPVLNRNLDLAGDARDSLAWLDAVDVVERDGDFFRWSAE